MLLTTYWILSFSRFLCFIEENIYELIFKLTITSKWCHDCYSNTFPQASLGTFKSCILCNYSKYIFLFKNLIFITPLRISCSVFPIVLPTPIQFPPDPPQLPLPLNFVSWFCCNVESNLYCLKLLGVGHPLEHCHQIRGNILIGNWLSISPQLSISSSSWDWGGTLGLIFVELVEIFCMLSKSSGSCVQPPYCVQKSVLF